MPTFHFDHPLAWYVLWNVLGFLLSIVVHSFLEHFSHRFVLHSKAIVKFAYEEHDLAHHNEYGADETFAVPGKDYGTDFGVREWLIFLVVLMPLWAGVEALIGKPILIGTFLSVVLWLQAFNTIHRAFHAPSGAWFERTWYYRLLREHHRGHHRDRTKNYNVAFFALADVVLGTYKAEQKG